MTDRSSHHVEVDAAAAPSPTPVAPPDRRAVARAVRDLIGALGFDPESDAFAQSPERVAEFLCGRLLSGYGVDAAGLLARRYPCGAGDLVAIRDIPFVSLCPHHLVPFFGVVHLAYVPGDEVLGLGRFHALVQAVARRFQLQEALAAELVRVVEEALEPRGVACRVVATQLCANILGEAMLETTYTSEVVRGCFATDPERLAQFHAALAAPSLQARR